MPAQTQATGPTLRSHSGAPSATPAVHPPESLTRLLMQWGVRTAAPAGPLAEQLGGWLGWADAVRLSQVLSMEPTQAPAGEPVGQTPAFDAAEAALNRLQTELSLAFEAPELARDAAAPGPPAAPLADLLAPLRWHHAQQQRRMAARVAGLRAQLREHLVGATPALAAVAALDAVFERVLAAPEQQRLAGLPAVLTRRAEQHHATDPRHSHRHIAADLQRLLRAELDLRLQPLRALVEALPRPAHPAHPHPPTCLVTE